MKKLYSKLLHGIFYVVFFLFLALIIASGSGKKVNYASNISSATNLKVFHFESKYDDLNLNLNVRECSNMDEVSLYGATSPVSFVGQMTGYGPDCDGCGGRVSCPPRQDVRNGNIYYQDKIYGIVLDRGGVIVGNIIDFLVVSEADSYAIGRQKNVNFTVVRWGW